MQRPIKAKSIISQIKDLTPDVRHFELELDQEFNFKSGQFVNLSFKEGDEIYRRPYSIASHPLGKNKFELCIKLVEGGKLTPNLWNKKEGDEVEIMGPFGLFNLDKLNSIEETDSIGTSDIKPELVFIATGTGIAPLRSMIKDLIANEEEYNIKLIFGVRFENHHLYEKEFLELEKLSPNFKYLPVVSRPTQDWEGRQGHVQQNLDLVDPLNSQVFICGLPQMVDSVVEELENRGLTKDKIHFEKY